MEEKFANRLQKAMQLKNIKAAELSKKANIPKSAISQYLSGLYEAKQKSIFKLAHILNVSEGWLMGLDVPMEREFDRNIQVLNKKNNDSAVVLIYGTIPAGIPMECIEDIIDTEKIPTNMLKGGKEFFGLKIKGDSMEPNYLDGDIIILQKQDDCESGDDCVVMVNGNEGTFKRVFKNENGIILQPLNNKYQPMPYSNEQIETLPVKILGVFEELRRKKKKK